MPASWPGKQRSTAEALARTLSYVSIHAIRSVMRMLGVSSLKFRARCPQSDATTAVPLAVVTARDCVPMVSPARAPARMTLDLVSRSQAAPQISSEQCHAAHANEEHRGWSGSVRVALDRVDHRNQHA